MKGIDLFCASQASTAICVSMDKSSVVLQGGRAIDRHNPHLRDARRSSKGLLNPPSSPSPSHSHNSRSQSQQQPPTKSKPYSQNQNQKKTAKKSSGKATDLISPPGSTRYLLSDTSFFDVYSDFDPISASVPVEPSGSRPLSLNPDDSPALKPPSSSSASSSSHALKSSSSSTLSLPSPALKPPSSSSSTLSPPSFTLNPSSSSSSLPPPSPALKPSSSSSSTSSRDQVVVLRVSLHCKGCEGKVRKHISRMEGVTSFSIDFAAKKVTVIGDVTPLSVLASLSRVKNAQLLPL